MGREAPAGAELGYKGDLSRLLDASGDPIVGLDLTGRFTYVNRAASSMFGIEPFEMLGRSWSEMGVQGPHLAKLAQSWNRVLAGQGERDVVTVVTPGGHRVHEYTANPILDANGAVEAVVVSARDVTEQRLVEERLRKLARLSDDAAEMSSDPEALVEAAARQAVDLGADVAFVCLLSEDGHSLGPFGLHHRNDEARALLDALLRQRLAHTGGRRLSVPVFDGETTILRGASLDLARSAVWTEFAPYFAKYRVGAVVVVPSQLWGKVVGLVAVAREQPGPELSAADISILELVAQRTALTLRKAQDHARERRQRERAERAAREASRRAERIEGLQRVTAALAQALTPQEVACAVVTEGMQSLGAHAGGMVLLDEAGAELTLGSALGFSLVSLAAWRRFPVTDPNPLAAAVRTKAPVWLENRAVLHDRYPAWEATLPQQGKAWAAVPLEVHGHVLGCLGLSFDREGSISQEDRSFIVTLARQCAQALQRTRLLQREREARVEAEAAVRARDELVSVAAHELRSPIASLRGYAEVLLDEYRASGGVQSKLLARAMNVIERQTGTLARMIGQLLNLNQLEFGETPLHLRVENVTDLVEGAVQQARARTGMHRFTLTKTPQIYGRVDALLLDEVLANLLDNAIKYSPDGGDIEVHVGDADGGNIVISVRDHGVGVPPGSLNQVFERFYRAHSESGFRGMGIGLYVARRILEMHGGQITADLPQDGGTRFVVTLPCRVSVDTHVDFGAIEKRRVPTRAIARARRSRTKRKAQSQKPEPCDPTS